MKPCRIGWVGQLDVEGTCKVRMDSLAEVGESVFGFDSGDYFRSKIGRIGRALEVMLMSGRRYSEANEQLIRFARKNKIDTLWVDKGSWIRRSTLHRLTREGIVLIHHVTDSLWPRSFLIALERTQLRHTVGDYKVLITTNSIDALRLRKYGKTRVLLSQLGYDAKRFTPPPQEREFVRVSQAVFVGHYEPRTERYCVALARAGVRLRISGAGWQSLKNTNSLLSPYVSGRISNDEYLDALYGSKIGLGFVSEWNYNQSAGRSYEIPATNTFLLGMRTKEHLSHFQEGKEAEFFQDENELVYKAKKYFGDESSREQIAHAGRRRVVMSGYSWQEIMKRDWQQVKKELSATSADRA